MQLIADTMPKKRRPKDDCCQQCSKHLDPEDRVFLDREGRLFCSVRCALTWARGAQ